MYALFNAVGRVCVDPHAAVMTVEAVVTDTMLLRRQSSHVSAKVLRKAVCCAAKPLLNGDAVGGANNADHQVLAVSAIELVFAIAAI